MFRVLGCLSQSCLVLAVMLSSNTALVFHSSLGHTHHSTVNIKRQTKSDPTLIGIPIYHLVHCLIAGSFHTAALDCSWRAERYFSPEQNYNMWMMQCCFRLANDKHVCMSGAADNASHLRYFVPGLPRQKAGEGRPGNEGGEIAVKSWRESC